MTSPVVPKGYDLRNTFETDSNIDQVRLSIESALKSIGVYYASPDKLMYMCKCLYKHQIFNFWVMLFHDNCEFVEIRHSCKNFYEIEDEFAKRTGFTPRTTNTKTKPPTLYLPPECIETINILPIPENDIAQDIERALFYTDDNATYTDLFLGISLTRQIFKITKNDELFTRLCKLARFAPEPELRCLSLDALQDRLVAEYLLDDKDDLVRLTAERIY